MPGPLRTVFTAVVIAAAACCGHAQTVVARTVVFPRDEIDFVGRHHQRERVVDDDLVRDWRGARDRLLAEHATHLLLELSSTSGTAAAALAIADDLADLRQRGVRIVVFVPQRALGVGALIAAEADQLVVAPDATIGGIDLAQAGGGPAGDIAVTQRSALQRLRATAARCQWPTLFAEAMVDPEVEIVRLRRAGRPVEFLRGDDAARARAADPEAQTDVLKRRGECLRVGAADALLFGFPWSAAATRDEAAGLLGADATATSLNRTVELPSAVTTGAFESLRWELVLLVLGVLFLILELKTPGVALWSILSVLCFAAYFLIQGSVGVGATFCLTLLLVGFLLLFVEILFLPGTIAPGVLGVICIVASIYAATIDLRGVTLTDRLIPKSPDEWDRVRLWGAKFLGLLTAGAVGALSAVRFLPNLPVIGHIYRTPVSTGSGAPDFGPAPALAIGDRGIADTDLRPFGVIRCGSMRIDVATGGEFIGRGTPVHVTAIAGSRITVQADETP